MRGVELDEMGASAARDRPRGALAFVEEESRAPHCSASTPEQRYDAAGNTVSVTSGVLIARMQEAVDRTGELDWSLVRPDFEIHDHELPDSSMHRGREGWQRWVSDWQQASEDYRFQRLEQVELDERRIITIHRLRARGRASGVQFERTDAQLWTFSGDRLARMDYYPDYRTHERSLSLPGAAPRSAV